MVDHGRCREPSLCLATHTQGMPAEVRLAESLPPAAVSTLGGRRSVWMQELMLRTIQTVCQIGTAGVTAWFLTLPRHSRHTPHSIRSFQHESFSVPCDAAL